MGDLLRLVHNHPEAEIAGIFDPGRGNMARAIEDFAIPSEHVFTGIDQCMKTTKADLAILCVATAEHAAYTEKLAATFVICKIEPFPAFTRLFQLSFPAASR